VKKAAEAEEKHPLAEVIGECVNYGNIESGYHVGVLEEVGSRATIQPLPGYYSPLPAKIKWDLDEVTPIQDKVDMARVKKNIEAAKKVSAARSVQTRAAFDKVKERLAKIPKKPKAEPKLSVVAKYRVDDERVAEKFKDGSWAKCVFEAVKKIGDASVQDVIDFLEKHKTAPETKMTLKVAATWYLNDLKKKGALEAV
jgi:hypothetical protein